MSWARDIMFRHLKYCKHLNCRKGIGMADEKDVSQVEDLELMKRMRWCSHILYHRYNLNFSRNKILYLLYRDGPMTQKTLMDHMHIQAGSLSEMLSKLECGGLIEKTRCPHDKRNCSLALTQAGEEQALVFEKERQDMASFLFSPLADEDKQRLACMLDTLIDHWTNTPCPAEGEKENTNA